MNLTNITELCDIQIGRTPKRSEDKYWGEGHNWLSIADMDSKYVFASKEQVTDLAVDECRMKIVPKNTVVMSFKLTIGRLGITDKELYTNEAIAAFLIKDKNLLLPEYLYYSLKGYNFDHLIDRAAKGKTLNKRKLSEIYIPLLSIDKQKKIIDILNKAENLLGKRQQQIEALSALKQSVFFDVFGDPFKNPNNYPLQKLDEVCINIFGGGTPSKRQPEYYVGDIPWVTPKDMKTETIFETTDNINDIAIENSSAKLIPKKSLLMVIRSGILKHTLPISINKVDVTVNQDMKAFVVDEKKLLVEYLFFYFKCMENRILSKVRAVTAHNIEFKELLKSKVPLPDLNLQNQFRTKVKDIDRNMDILNESLKELSSLYDSLLHKAFNGELFKEEIKA